MPHVRTDDFSAGDRPWSVELLADDVVAFLDALDLDRVHYIGESVGGITGIAFGARLSEDRVGAGAVGSL